MKGLCFCCTFEKKVMTEQHYGDLYRWVEKVINSCETEEQLKRADRLIYFFSNHETIREIWNNDYKLYLTLTADLNRVIMVKMRDLINSDSPEIESIL